MRQHKNADEISGRTTLHDSDNRLVNNMTLSLTDILIRPDAFFGTLTREKESLKIPSLIVLAGGIVAAAYGYLIGGLTARMMASAVPGIETIITISTIGGALIGTFVFWVLWAGITYGISLAFKGQGSFSRVLQVIGYGYLPQVLGSLITLVAAMQYIPKIAVPTLSSAALQDPAVMQEAMKAFLHDPAMFELMQITSLVSIVFLLWSANIWIFGMKHARVLSMRDAAISVGIPVVAYVLYMTYNLGVM
jgi:hypothetical protein